MLDSNYDDEWMMDGSVRAEIANAELSMAVDGSFVETPSSHAARDLKKRLDQLLGVGKNGMRSPYALTITQSASGARVFRVGFRPSDTHMAGLVATQHSPTRTHRTDALLPAHTPAYRPRASASEDVPAAVPAGPQYVRLDTTDLQIYSRTGDSDIFSSAMGWSDAPRDVTREPRPISERPFLQLDPGAFPFGRGVLYTKPLSGASFEGRRSLEKPPEPTDTTLPALLKYPTGVFQVLQTFRGLPTLDVLLESHDTPTARLSTTTSAVPENDPRFVIFGDLKPPSDTIIAVGRRKITKPKPGAPPHDRDPPDQRVMMAATIERWVAQLTSELNYDALLDFFLTYRAYVSANDLGHLLICRFHWALEPTSSAQDETVRRIVRVRTFIAFRYWLSTFFQVDFLPNRLLRSEFTSWLNALRKSPMLTAKPDAVIIVQKLKKIVRECKEAHVPKPEPRSPQSPIERTPVEPTPLNLHALRTAFEPLAHSPVQPGPTNDSDLDLVSTPILDPIKGKSNPSSPPRKSSLALPFARTDPPPPSKLVPISMPMHHGPLTRAFVNTVGRLSRWKRGLGTRSMMVGSASVGAGVGCVDPGAFDEFGLSVGVGMADASVGTEVVAVRGGVEEYLKMCGLATRARVEGTVTPDEIEKDLEDKDDQVEADPDPEGNDLTVVPVKEVVPRVLELEEGEKGRDTPTSTSTPRLLSQFPSQSEMGKQPSDGEGSLRHSRRASDATQMQLYASTLRESWLPETETISIDDADLSDSSSEAEIVRRPPRRLPNRRDLEFAAMRGQLEFSAARTESVSSLGAPSSVPSVPSVLSASDPTTPDHTGGAIQSWQIDFLGEESDDGAGPGDAEAALQRLEGQIDAEEQRLRDLKVDRWLKRVQELGMQRAGVGLLDMMAGINFEDDEGLEGDTGENKELDDGAEPQSVSMRPSLEIPSAGPGTGSAIHPVPDSASSRPANDAASSRPAQDSSSARVMSEIMYESGPHSVYESTSHLVHDQPSLRQRMHPKKGRLAKDTSFLLQHRSEVIAHNLSVIERGLFVAISFEELVMHNWGPQSHELDVTDWMQYRTDAAQHRIQPSVQKEGGRDLLTSDVLAVRARFNLTANFVASEVVLAHHSQRVVLVNKLIRIAWKLYRMNNFATLCAIITGLASVWVNAAMKRLWQSVGMWEMRVFKDLKWFTSSTDNFRFMRDAILSVTHDNRIETPSDKGSEQLVGCIPFLGMYLSELSEYAKLPDFIDPTRPEEPIQLDPATGEFEPLRDPEVFSTLPELPPYMSLRPLLNVHKQRQIAGVVKALVGGQHMASACRFTVEQKVYSKCLRLKCADAAALWRALAAEGA